MTEHSSDDTTSALFDANVRIERIIWIPGIGSADALCDDFKEFCESEIDCSTLHPTLKAVPAFEKWARSIDDDPDLVAEELAVDLAITRAAGFLVQGATPFRHHRSKTDQAYTSGWGNYHTQWLYAATPAAITSVLVAWAADMAARDQAATS